MIARVAADENETGIVAALGNPVADMITVAVFCTATAIVGPLEKLKLPVIGIVAADGRPVFVMNTARVAAVPIDRLPVIGIVAALDMATGMVAADGRPVAEMITVAVFVTMTG